MSAVERVRALLAAEDHLREQGWGIAETDPIHTVHVAGAEDVDLTLTDLRELLELVRPRAPFDLSAVPVYGQTRLISLEHFEQMVADGLVVGPDGKRVEP